MALPRGIAALLLTFGCATLAAEPPGYGNWANDKELEGIVDLLDFDYLQRPIRVERLPLKYAVTTVFGRGENVVYTFEDPNCGYCRQLTRRLEEIGDVTVHTFILTFLGDDSASKADAVWCAADRSRAWLQVMRGQAFAAAPQGCRSPRAETMRLAGLLGINLTPTLFFADGSRMNGIKPRSEIAARLKAAGRSSGLRQGRQG